MSDDYVLQYLINGGSKWNYIPAKVINQPKLREYMEKETILNANERRYPDVRKVSLEEIPKINMSQAVVSECKLILDETMGGGFSICR